MSGSAPRSVVVEADGGSRGNPGPAAYGAVLKDATTGAVLAEEGTTIGVATNNVAEYSGLIAGLRLAAELAPEADIEVRMDSKLVVEQMSGRWKIKHPDMRPLATEATRLAPFGTTYTWVPREQNKHADRLANEALDGKRSGVTVAGEQPVAPAPAAPVVPARSSWGPPGPATTLVLIRHGVTAHTTDKRFSGGLASSNPGLSDEGRAQVRATADWLAPLASEVGAVVASPVRRAQESAEIVAARLERPLEVEPGLAEMEFGRWDGLTLAEVGERDRAGLDGWLGALDVAPPGGESFLDVQARVLAGLERVLERHAEQTVVVVSHVTPIKTLVARALDAPLESIWRMQLSPASVSVVSFFPEGRSSMRLYNARPSDAFSAAASAW
ncbi:bifunctional RNase H/acid phosphatase [Nocardioides anomalus]|uniref:Bifunctional RNase H/acid phosphatase n=1 Tax=Nocardioides anomalus TaxID=2712223 RepID=A0A6G6WC57_9ACTN|nr:bifunctional RNase H/acid phosphatase [Nocardioides anomalus]QIG42799.1 bifunctional RNase H/acid phosphatase [Nocardioides anomalus]